MQEREHKELVEDPRQAPARAAELRRGVIESRTQAPPKGRRAARQYREASNVLHTLVVTPELEAARKRSREQFQEERAALTSMARPEADEEEKRRARNKRKRLSKTGR